MSTNTPSPTPKRDSKVSDHFVLRNCLNIAFILLTIMTITVYFLWPKALGGYLYMCLGLVAVIIKMIEVSIRINFNRKNK